jgi:tripartite-type tricarboxylate transporter receptor subunit TctC
LAAVTALGTGGALTLGVAAASAPAAGYPTKPIRIVVPFLPGGGADITGRALAQNLAESWGQPVLVDNRPGANGTIGAGVVAKAAPDGYTIGMITTSHSVNVSLFRKLPYDLLRDLAPITQATSQPYALVVHPSVPVRTVQELVALAKAKPGTINYGSSGTGGFSHLAGAAFAAHAGIQLMHVPYRGGAAALADLLGGQIQMLFSTILQSQAHIKAGKLRALAVTSPMRSPAQPDVPTMAESGLPAVTILGWYGFVAPAKMPAVLIDRHAAEMRRILHLPDVVLRLATDGSEPVGSAPAEFGRFIRAEVERWARVVKEAGIQPLD